MTLLADECCDGALVAALRSDGHDVLFAAEALSGTPDDAVLARAYAEGRILLTEDRDFGDLVVRLGKPAVGVVYLRFSVAERALKVPRLRWLLGAYPDRLRGSFTVLDREKARIRPLG